MTVPAEVRAVAERWAAAEAELTAPGAPFALTDELVLGERMAVFAHRTPNLRVLLHDATAAHGDRLCVVTGDGTERTFAEFGRDVAATAAVLRDHGVDAGSHVAIAAANSLGWLLSYWAAVSMGAVVVAMNGWWSEVEVRHALDLAEPALVLGDGPRLAVVRSVRPDLRTVDLDGELPGLVVARRGAAAADAAIDEDDPAMLIFTSGTTGRPKAAVLSHRCLLGFVQLQSFIAARGMAVAGVPAPTGPPPTRLAVAPLFHVSGMSATLSGIQSGATTVWPLGRFDPAATIELTKRYGIATWNGAITHVMRLLDDPAIETLDPRQLVQIGIGGSATTPLLMRRTEERFPHLKGTFASGYGSTETGGLVSYASNAMLVAAPDCIGPPLPTVEVRITDPFGDDVPPGSTGVLTVRSPIVMREYWRHPEANADAFLPGRWFRTGDVGRMEAGVLFLSSRDRDLIIRGGENIYPFEVENRLEEHPDVVECAVVPVDHPSLGHEVKAIVVVREGAALTAHGVRDWCAGGLAAYKVPAHVELRTEPLPRNATGKILKHVLRDDQRT